jgi:hypothetical protein
MELIGERVKEKVNKNFVSTVWEKCVLKATRDIERDLCFKFLENFKPNDKE